MKRFWLVMLSLGLVLAFSAQAFAVDVKFSGSYYAAGMYLDKTNLTKDAGSDGISTAFYYQRLRVQTDFIVSPGLKLVTRFDAMERAWGAPRSTAATTGDSLSAGTTAENENIAFDLAYVEYASPIGIFHVGYIYDNGWGTVFGNAVSPTGGIEYILPIGNFVIGGEIYKEGDNSRTAKLPSIRTTDQDADKYCLWGIYNINKDINVGLLGGFYRGAGGRATAYPDGSLFSVYFLIPYVKAKFGPVTVEAEVNYGWGKIAMEDGVIGNDKDVKDFTVYVNAVADLGPVYFGGTFAYLAGDDPSTTDKLEGGGNTGINGGADWNPTLIMFNYDRTYWAGAIPGYSGLANSSAMANAWFGQGKIGVRPIPALDINASLSYAVADKKPAGVLNSAYGWEVDVTGTYKITNNLSYMLGVGYWLVGDYYKGNNAVAANDLRNNYLLINKLTLTF